MQPQLIESKIYSIRGQKVMMDFDLAELYETETKVLKQTVRRNWERFPEDFMFQLSKEEFESLRSHFVTSNRRGGTRYMPFAFTEQGVAMLSGVLKTPKAVQVNIAIMRAFVAIRQFALNYAELTQRIAEIEKRLDKNDESLTDVFQAIHFLLQKDSEETEQKNRRKIGFKK